jgi:transcriptional regulator with XRE-family HTH domain
MAKLVGVKQRSWSGYEAGTSEPRVVVLAKIAELERKHGIEPECAPQKTEQQFSFNADSTPTSWREAYLIAKKEAEIYRALTEMYHAEIKDVLEEVARNVSKQPGIKTEGGHERKEGLPGKATTAKPHAVL